MILFEHATVFGSAAFYVCMIHLRIFFFIMLFMNTHHSAMTLDIFYFLTGTAPEIFYDRKTIVERTEGNR